MASVGYTRQSSFVDGDTITSDLFNNEYNQLVNAFTYSSSGTTGHQHDGTAGEGGNIPQIGDQDFLNKVVVDTSNNRVGFFVEVSSSAVEQIRVQDGAIVPVTNNDIDLGTSSLQFKDAFFDGTVEADALTINGTTLAETISDTVGAMVSSNTETNITVSYDDSDNTLDFVVGTLNQDTTGNAATATALETARDFSLTGNVTASAISFSGTGNVALSTTIGNSVVTNDMLAGSIANAKLANSTVSFGGISLALGASDATPAFDLSDATNYPTSSLSGTITNAQLAGSIANAKLANSSITVTDGSTSTATALGGTITFAAGEGLDVGESSGTVTFSAEDATSSNKGVASFDSTDFSVSSGAVTLQAERIQDIVGGMVSSNTESGITVAYEDSDGTLDFTVGTLNQDTTGNAATATALETARTIHGVSFDGTANIDLSEVVQDTVGAMFTSNTETGITATYQDSDGTIDLVTDVSSLSAPTITSPKIVGEISIAPSEATTQTLTVTVASKTSEHPYDGGSSNAYVIDSVESPYLTLVPDTTYRFDQADSSNSGHPLRFYYESDKTTAYTTGVTTNGTPGSAGAYTEIKATVSTPTVLFYQCSSHALMGNRVNFDTRNLTGFATGDLVTSGSVTNSMLANSSVSYGGISLALGASDGTPAFDLSDATNYPTSSLSGTITNAQLAGSIANSKLANSSITVSDGSSSTATALGGTITFSGTSNEVEVGESSGTITVGLPSATQITTSLGVGGGSTNGVQISQGAIAIKNGGTQSYIDFYCESSNAHYARLQSAAHSAYSGNITLTLPTTTDTLVGKTTTDTLTNKSLTAPVLTGSSSSAGKILFKEDTDNGTNAVTLIGPASTGDVTVTLPSSAGTLALTSDITSTDSFKTISVSGQSDVVADSTTDTLTLVAGANTTITTDASSDTITITSAGSASAEANQNAFSNVAVSGQTTVAADSQTDTLTFVAGSNITLTTDASADSVTIAAAGGGFTSITRSGKTADYTIVAGDTGKVIEHTDNDITLTLTAAATLGDGFHVWVKNLAGTGDVTSFAFNGSEHMDGKTNDKLYCGESFHIYCDGSNFKILDDDRGVSTNIGDDYDSRPVAEGDKSIAIGLNAVSVGTSTIVLGAGRASNTESASINIATNSAAYGASGNYSTAIGNYAKASGLAGFAFGGTTLAAAQHSYAIGYSSEANSTGGQAFGYNAVASGNYSIALGKDSTTGATDSVSIGKEAYTNVLGKIAFSSGEFSALGDCQEGLFVLKSDTTDATAEKMTTDNNSTADSGNQVQVRSYAALAFHGMVVCRQQSADGTDCSAWRVEGLARRENAASTTTLVNSAIHTINNATNLGLAISADTTNGAVSFTVTGESSHNLRWVGTIHTTETYYQ